MNERRALLAGAGIGAGLMYLLDPERGRRRRALVRDQMKSIVGRSEDAMSTTARDMRNRARGLVAEARQRVAPDDVPDPVLAERVRAELGHYTAHPAAIGVIATDGRVTLRGACLTRDAGRLVRAVGRVRGVRAVDNALELHDAPGGIPALQGGVERAGRRPELFPSHWSPTARVLVGGLAVGLLARAVARRDGVGAALGVLGLGLMARAASNLETRRLLGFAPA